MLADRARKSGREQKEKREIEKERVRMETKKFTKRIG